MPEEDSELMQLLVTACLYRLLLTQLNAEQVAMVEANSRDLDSQVPVFFKLDWKGIVFEGRLGSGSFGDCYRGR